MAWMVLVFVLTVPQMVLAGHPIVTQDTIYIRDTVYVKHTTVIMGGKPKKANLKSTNNLQNVSLF